MAEHEPEESIFSRIMRGEIPATLVHDDEYVIGLADIAPQAPVHVLFVPRHPIATLDDARPEHALLLGRLMLAAAAYARQVGIAKDGYRVVMNTNAEGGQSVYHIHLHLLGGRPMQWPPG
jgi:histidine triad (HIT) family protein